MIIGITGYKGSGKDTLASFLKPRIGPCVQINFADPIKDICEIAFCIDEHGMIDRNKKEAVKNGAYGLSPRQLMQIVGTEMFRSRWPSIWIDAWRSSVNMAQYDGYNVVCTDYRFPDEADALRLHDALLIRVDRDGCGPDGHASESHILDLPHDIVIDNNGSLDDLRMKAEEIEL